MKKLIYVSMLAVFIFLIYHEKIISENSKRIVALPWDGGTISAPDFWTTSIKGYDKDGANRSDRMSYVLGYLDAMTLVAYDSKIAEKFLTECKGMDLDQLLDTVDKFYKEYPELADNSPAFVMLQSIPRMRKGLFPVPEPITK